MAVRTDLDFIRGDDTQLGLLVLDDDGGPLDLTGKRVELEVKTGQDGTTVFTLSSVDGAPPLITITDAAAGEGIADLSDLLETSGVWWYESWVADVSDPLLDKETWAYGDWRVAAVGAPGGAPANRPCGLWPLLPATAEQCAWFEEQESAVLIYNELWMAASEILWARSGRRWGICTFTVRPCGQHTPCPDANLWNLVAWPRLWTGALCGCTGRCGHDGSYLRLPRPVAGVSEVIVDGVVLDPSEYEVVQWKWLHRISGEAWPATQDLGLPVTEPDTFQVTFDRGRPVPFAGQIQVTELFRQYLLAAAGGEGCYLAQNVTETIRKGVRTVSDPATVLKSYNRTGITSIDLWLTTVNPNGLRSRARAYSTALG